MIPHNREVALQLRGVQMSYRSSDGDVISIVENLGLIVRVGEMHCLKGRSGVGKTTILRIAHGQIVPTCGEVAWAGLPIDTRNDEALSARRNEFVGYLDQSSTMLPGLTLLENVLMPAVPTRSARALRRRARGLLDELGLTGRLDHEPHELSGGETRRGALARALLMDPGLVIADEPTANLDEPSARRVVNVLRRLARSGTGVLVASHDALLIDEADSVLELV